MFSSRDLTFCKTGEGCTVHLRGQTAVLAAIVPDDVYSAMWRIRTGTGYLSDMVNFARAKDGAITIALDTLNPRKDARERPGEAPPMRETAPVHAVGHSGTPDRASAVEVR